MGDYGSWSAVYNALSFGIAGMGSATIFFWLQIYNVNKKYRTALTITGLVTAIATYHYFRIFNSWNDAFDVKFDAKAVMVALGYPGEIQDSASGRWMWWFFAMIPF